MPKIHPLVTSAPLNENPDVDSNNEVPWPLPSQVAAELRRAAAELEWALRKHRSAWDKMQRLAREYEDKGNAFFKDNERPWKLAIGDVQWWRGEVSARSNSVLALRSLADLYGVDVRPYHNVSAPSAEQQFVRGRT